MAPIGDVTALKPVLATLVEKGLLVALTPEGRGQIVAHTLYEPREMERLKAQHGRGGWTVEPIVSQPPAAPPVSGGPSVATETPGAPTAAPSTGQPAGPVAVGEIAALREEVSQLKEEVSRLRSEVEDLWSNLR